MATTVKRVKKKRDGPRALRKPGKCQNQHDGAEDSIKMTMTNDTECSAKKHHAVPVIDKHTSTVTVETVPGTQDSVQLSDAETNQLQDSNEQLFLGNVDEPVHDNAHEIPDGRCSESLVVPLKLKNVLNGVLHEHDEDSPQFQNNSSDRLSIQDLKYVRKALFPARMKWYDIGVELSMDPILLETIKNKHLSNDPSDFLTNMLSEYLKQAYPRPTWESLANALKQDTVAQGQIAEEIERIYLKKSIQEPAQPNAQFWIPSTSDSALHPTGLADDSNVNSTDSDCSRSCSPISQTQFYSQNDTLQSGESNSSASQSVKHKTFQCLCGSCSLSKYMTQGCPEEGVESKQYPYLDTKGLSKPAREDLEAKLDSEVDKMIESFADLSHSIIESLEMQGTAPIKLARCALSIGTYKSHKILKPFSEKNSSDLVQAQSIDEIFIILFRHMSFFNHELLEFVIGKLGTESDRNKLESYTAEFEIFCQRSVFEVPPDIYLNVHGCEIPEDCKPYAVKLEGDWKLTVGDVKKAQRRIAALLDIQPSTLLLCNVHEGCVKLELSLPKEVYDEVIPLSPKQVCDLQSYDMTECVTEVQTLSNEKESGLAVKSTEHEIQPKVQTKEFETTLSANGVSSWSLHEEPCPATVQSVDPPTSIPDSVIKSTIVDDGPKQNIAGWTNCACKKYKGCIVLSIISILIVVVIISTSTLVIFFPHNATNQNGEAKFCPEDNDTNAYGKYLWNETLENRYHTIPCEYGGIDGLFGAMATRTCDKGGDWNDAVYDKCLTLTTFLLCNLTELSLDDSIDELLANLLTAVTQSNANDQTIENFKKITSIFQKFVNCTSNACVLNFNQLSTITSVLDLLHEWENISQPTNIVQYVEELLGSYVKGLEIQDSEGITTATFSHENVVFIGLQGNYSELSKAGVSFIDQNDSSGFTVAYEDVDDYQLHANATPSSSVTLSPEVFNQLMNKSDEELNYAVILFGVYNSTTFFPLRNDSALFASENIPIESLSIGTPLLSATITGYDDKALNEDIDITIVFKLETEEPQEVQCILWDENATEGQGDWSADSCNTTFRHSISSAVICRCNHFSTFGIVVNKNRESSAFSTGPVISLALLAATYTSSAVSVVELGLAIFTTMFFRENRCKIHSKFHVQLLIALIGMIATFCLGIDRSENKTICTVFSTLIQYFTLASVFWMGAEALLLIKTLIFVFRRISRTFMLVTSLFCWGMPSVFVVIGLTTLATGNNYLVVTGNDFEQCFIGDIRIQIGLFWIPISIIMACNTVVFFITMRVLIKSIRRRKKERKICNSIATTVVRASWGMIAILSLTILFGLSWLFLTLSIDNGSIIFRWLFISSNTLQSTSLFIFFCVKNPDQRRLWINLLKCNCIFNKKHTKNLSALTTISSCTRPTALKDSLYDATMSENTNLSV